MVNKTGYILQNVGYLQVFLLAPKLAICSRNCVTGDQNQAYITGSRTISRRVCVTKTFYFLQKLDHLEACFLVTRTGYMLQNVDHLQAFYWRRLPSTFLFFRRKSPAVFVVTKTGVLS